jgi:gliding motility-associated lipoprotein GldD
LKKGAYSASRLPYRQWLLLSVLVFIGACTEDYQPKPEGYFRIGLPGTTYTQLETDCPYTFQLNNSAQFKPKKDCWADIYYGQIRGTIQLTYKDLRAEGDLDNVLKEAQELAYKHTVAAQGIGEKLYLNPERKVYGILYQMQGNAASSAQFYATDSATHFLRGVLYFYSAPNADSLQPVNAFMYDEMVHLMESLEWKN